MRASKLTRGATFALAVGSAVLAGPPSAGAVEATQAEADRIRGVIEDYVGTPAPGAPRIVDVVPKGDAYDLVVDLEPLLPPPDAAGGLRMKFGRITSRLEPLADGTWRQTLDSFPPMSFSVGKDHSEAHYDGLTVESIFDPVGRYSPRTTLHAAKLTATSEHPKDDKGPGAVTEMVEEGVDVVATAGPAASGTGLDAAATHKIAKLTETIRTTGGVDAGVPDMTMTLAASDHLADMHVTGLRHTEILDLWKWVVAKHGFVAAKVDPGFKQRLAALGPVFDTVAGSGSLQNIGVETPFGLGGAKTLKFSIDGTGLGRDGRLGFGFDLSELKLHTMLAPAWAIRLLPTDVTLRAKGNGWNLGDVVQTWLDIVDFAHPRPLTPEEKARLAALALPKGIASIDVDGNHVKGALWDVTVDGKVDAGSTGAKGTVTIRATGLDAVASALAEPRDPNAQQALAALTMVTAQAVREGDAQVWRFVFDGDAITLNGKPFAKKNEPAPDKDVPAESETKPGKPNGMPHPNKLLQKKI